MEREDVSGPQGFLHIHLPYAVRKLGINGKIWVACAEPKFERRSALEDGLRDFSASDGYKIRASGGNHGTRRHDLPNALPYLSIDCGELTRERHGQRKRVICDFFDAIVRDIADRDPVLDCGVDVDIVHSNAVANDNFADAQALDDRLRNGSKLHKKCVRLLRRCNYILFALALEYVEFTSGAFYDASLGLDRRKSVVSDDKLRFAPHSSILDLRFFREF